MQKVLPPMVNIVRFGPERYPILRMQRTKNSTQA
jgi:hypothetical protein